MISNLTDFFTKGALILCPEKIALVDQNKKYTFLEWDRLARSVSSKIWIEDVPVNSVVAVFLPKCAEELIVDLGVLYSGCAFSNIDCTQPISRLQNLMQKLKPTIVIVDSDHVQLAQECGIERTRIFKIEDILKTEPLISEKFEKCRAHIIDTDPACIINTSGSTGVPKSCILSHRGLIDFVLWFDETFQLGKNEIVGSLSPFHFDGYIPGLFISLYRGATVNVIPSNIAMFPIKLAQYLMDHFITFIFWVPTVMVNMASFDVFRDISLPSLKTICFAGEVFPTKHFNYWRHHLPWAKFINLYGPIEISVICTYFIIDREFSDDEPLPIGFPCRNTDILILNEHDQICSDSEIGEICVRGSSLSSGYWDNNEKTSIAFCQNPLNTHYPEIIYRTGDLAYHNERKEIMFIGRKDFQIKHQGNRIDLGEIEHFAVQIPGIRNVCVSYDTMMKQIVMFYEADSDISATLVRNCLGKNLPKIMLPTILRRLSELPRNANGKVDRKKISEITSSENV